MSDPQKWADIVPFLRSLYVITDPGKDADDEDTLVAINRMIRLGLLEVMGVTANLKPARMRARLAKGTLNVLGQGGIPVGFGTNCTQTADDGLDYQFTASYLAPASEIVDGKNLIMGSLMHAKPKSVILMLISGMTDAADVLRENTFLFSSKVRRVVIMGGVKATEDGLHPEIDEDGHFIPDTAANNKFDMESAEYLYKSLQQLGIPTTIVTRHAANAAKVPRTVYDDMAATGHPVGLKMIAGQGAGIEMLWQRTWMSADNPQRCLPERCSPEWFRGQFLGGDGEGLTGEDSIWDLVKTFNLYDPVTFVATHPTIRGIFFEPYVVESGGAEHMIIGVSPERHGVSQPAELAAYVHRSLVESLEMSMADRRRKTA